LPKGGPISKAGASATPKNGEKKSFGPKSQLDLTLSWRDRMFNGGKSVEET
jgi:hypothetical protein